jgi:hypothetical protein
MTGPDGRSEAASSATASFETFTATRDALHAVAEHVLAAARYQGEGRIGLAVVPGGFSTPPFGEPPRQVEVDGVDLVVRTGPTAAEPVDDVHVTRAPLRTLGDAAEHAGIAPGGPAEVYQLATPLDPDAPLDLDPDAAARIADWFALADAALVRWSQEIAADEPSGITLWPEHFDVAIRAAGVNYGASLGDEYVPEPYLYVGPPLPPPPSADEFWNVSFGAYRTWDAVATADDAVEFFRAGRRHALG